MTIPNTIRVVVLGEKLSPKPLVVTFRSEFEGISHDEVQHMIDRLTENGQVELSSEFFNVITLNLGVDNNEGVPLLDVYFHTELDIDNQYSIEMTDDFVNKITKP